MAFDKVTGKSNGGPWTIRPRTRPRSSFKQAGRRVLVCWTGEHVAGLDPATGKVFWKYPFAHADGHQRAHARRRAAIGCSSRRFYDGALMLQAASRPAGGGEALAPAGRSERQTDALHAMISTPYMEGDYVYGVDSYGELRCLDARTGDRIWEDQTAVPRARWATIHMVRNGARMWMFNERGELLIATLSPRRVSGNLPQQALGAHRWSNCRSGTASAGRIRPTPTGTFSRKRPGVGLRSLGGPIAASGGVSLRRSQNGTVRVVSPAASELGKFWDRHLARIIQCAVKRRWFLVGASPTWQLVAPAGSSRSGSGGNETVEAFDGKGSLGDSASKQAVT